MRNLANQGKNSSSGWDVEKQSLIPLLFGILFVLLWTPVKGLAEPPASPPTLPAQLPTAGSPVKPVPPKIIWQDNRLSLETVDWDLRQVFQAVSEKTGVEIRLEKEVSGKISYRGEKEPLEKVIDGLLRGAGEKNYVMASEKDKTRKVYILSKGQGGRDLAEGARKAKVKGKLKNGKEIEYYPGEIIVGVPRYVEKKRDLPGLIRELEARYALALLGRSTVDLNIALRFRILGGRDPLETGREILGDKNELVTYVTPNGMGPKSVEMPEGEFHVWTPVTEEEIVRYKKPRREVEIIKNPFLRYGKPYEGSPQETTYFEGQFLIVVREADFLGITYEDVLGIASEEGGILVNHGGYLNWSRDYGIYVPGLANEAEYAKKMGEIYNKIKSLRKDSGTVVSHRDAIHLDGIPNDPLNVNGDRAD